MSYFVNTIDIPHQNRMYYVHFNNVFIENEKYFRIHRISYNIIRILIKHYYYYPFF